MKTVLVLILLMAAGCGSQELEIITSTNVTVKIKDMPVESASCSVFRNVWHDKHLFIQDIYESNFQHHPDCPCSLRKYESEK